LIWTVNDFPAYGLLSGQQVSGYKGCPLCGPETCAEHAQLLSKMIFLGGRRFLAMDHRFRRARAAFNNHQELDMAPERPSGEEVLQWGTERSEFLEAGGQENTLDDPVKRHGVKRRSLLFDLPYWKVCIINFGQ
jgi:predicted  nucleic acid-binding Zn-ribbon protein